MVVSLWSGGDAAMLGSGRRRWCGSECGVRSIRRMCKAILAICAVVFSGPPGAKIVQAVPGGATHHHQRFGIDKQ
jgi:hypothetical protein